MAKITLTKDEFADLLVVYLFYKIKRGDEIASSENEEFEKLMERMKGTGLGSVTTNYYISMDSRVRQAFRRIKKTLQSGNNEDSIIVIKGKENE